MPIATIAQFFILVGTLFTAQQLFRFARFIWVYCLRPSSIGTYLHGAAPYALVTGASDGIGKAVAGELYDRGFNVIIHGRSEEKTKRVVEELKARPGPKRDVRYFLAPANEPGTDFEKLVEPFKDLNITFVVNNVGGGSNKAGRMDEYSEDSLMSDLRVNMFFAFYLTRAILPTLRKAAPAQVLFIGSQGAEIRIPRLYSYGPAKAFLKQLARSLDCDERWWTPTRVSFVYVGTGTVVTNAMRTKPHIFNPTSERFARALVSRVGCKADEWTAYGPHAVQMWVMKMLGDGFIEAYSAPTMKGILEMRDTYDDMGYDINKKEA